MIRSSVVPQTIASDTAQNANWNSHFDSMVASERPITPNAFCGSPKPCSRKPSVPMNEPLPNANPKPTA